MMSTADVSTFEKRGSTFKREVERELTGRETEPWEIVYFKLYKTQIPVVEQAIETAALLLERTSREVTVWK